MNATLALLLWIDVRGITIDDNVLSWLAQSAGAAFIGVLFGAPIAWWFAKRSSKDLRDAAAELKIAVRFIQRAQEAQANRPVYARDAEGNPTGVHQYLDIHDVGSSSDAITELSDPHPRDPT